MTMRLKTKHGTIIIEEHRTRFNHGVILAIIVLGMILYAISIILPTVKESYVFAMAFAVMAVTIITLVLLTILAIYTAICGYDYYTICGIGDGCISTISKTGNRSEDAINIAKAIAESNGVIREDGAFEDELKQAIKQWDDEHKDELKELQP